MGRQFIRPGYPTVTTETDDIAAGHAEAQKVWEEFGARRAAELNITAGEYARQARRGLVAQHIEANAKAHAERYPDPTPAQANEIASLYRRAAKAHERNT